MSDFHEERQKQRILRESIFKDLTQLEEEKQQWDSLNSAMSMEREEEQWDSLNRSMSMEGEEEQWDSLNSAMSMEWEESMHADNIDVLADLSQLEGAPLQIEKAADTTISQNTKERLKKTGRKKRLKEKEKTKKLKKKHPELSKDPNFDYVTQDIMDSLNAATKKRTDFHKRMEERFNRIGESANNISFEKQLVERNFKWEALDLFGKLYEKQGATKLVVPYQIDDKNVRIRNTERENGEEEDGDDKDVKFRKVKKSSYATEFYFDLTNTSRSMDHYQVMCSDVLEHSPISRNMFERNSFRKNAGEIRQYLDKLQLLKRFDISSNDVRTREKDAIGAISGNQDADEMEGVKGLLWDLDVLERLFAQACAEHCIHYDTKTRSFSYGKSVEHKEISQEDLEYLQDACRLVLVKTTNKADEDKEDVGKVREKASEAEEKGIDREYKDIIKEVIKERKKITKEREKTNKRERKERKDRGQIAINAAIANLRRGHERSQKAEYEIFVEDEKKMQSHLVPNPDISMSEDAHHDY